MVRTGPRATSAGSQWHALGLIGQLKMTVTLPDASALDNLARSLAHLLTPR